MTFAAKELLARLRALGRRNTQAPDGMLSYGDVSLSIHAPVLCCTANGNRVRIVGVVNQHNGTYQVFGLETGLRASAMIRELYSDDTLSGWLITMTEENAVKGNLFIDAALYNTLSA